MVCVCVSVGVRRRTTNQFFAMMSFPRGLSSRCGLLDACCLMAGREERLLRFWRSRPIASLSLVLELSLLVDTYIRSTQGGYSRSGGVFCLLSSSNYRPVSVYNLSIPKSIVRPLIRFSQNSFFLADKIN